MKKILASLVAALTIGGAYISTAEAAPPNWQGRPGVGRGVGQGYVGRGVGQGYVGNRGQWHGNRGHWRGDRGWGYGGAAAAGVVGGLLLGGALANGGYYGDYYGGPTYVYEDAPVVIRRAPHCRVWTKYDMYGRPYEWKDCN